MEAIVIYVLIGYVYGYNNYRLMASNGKKDKFPIYYHVVAGVFWPVSIPWLVWSIHKKLCNGSWIKYMNEELEEETGEKNL